MRFVNDRGAQAALEHHRSTKEWAGAFTLVALAAVTLTGCNALSVNRAPLPAPAPAPPTATAPVPQPAPAPVPVVPPVRPAASPAPSQARPALPPVADWKQYRLRAAQLIASANPQATFSGPLPDPLASIPVLQIQLNADGSVRHIEVLRTPKFEPQTVEMAKAAVMRAAPFGPVHHLPRPWNFNETFLYNDPLKFQLRSLVEGE